VDVLVWDPGAVIVAAVQGDVDEETERRHGRARSTVSSMKTSRVERDRSTRNASQLRVQRLGIAVMSKCIERPAERRGEIGATNLSTRLAAKLCIAASEGGCEQTSRLLSAAPRITMSIKSKSDTM
jgi:hypothetical protein